MDLEDAMCMNG